MGIMTYIQIFLAIAIILFFGYKFYTSKGRPVKILLYSWVNKQRVFRGEITGHILKRFKESTEEQLCFVTQKKKIWDNIPSSDFFTTDMKGNLLLVGVIDSGDFVYWIRPDNGIYREYTKKFEVPVLGKDGKPTYREEAVLDEDGKQVFEDILDVFGKPKLNSAGKVMQKAVMKKIPITKSVSKEVKELSPYDEVIEPDIKAYHINKKLELRELYRREDKDAFKKHIVAWAVVAIIVLGTFYISSKHLREIVGEQQETTNLFINAVNKLSASPPLSKKVDDFGQDSKTAGTGGK